MKTCPTLLVRSSWQTVNIGDIGHTPGLLALLERHLPECQIRLWPCDIRNGVEEMLVRRFPRVTLVKSDEDVAKAFADCDFLLHGSGPYLVRAKDLASWRESTGKPYGVFGITLPEERAGCDVIDLLNHARFVFFRDSVSLQVAIDSGVSCPEMKFGPDSAFACDLRNDLLAERFLLDHGLEEGQFLCCIGRFRNTPYWRIPAKNAAVDPVKELANESTKERDHAPLREAIERIVRMTSFKVLLCPEDETQMQVNREMLYDTLPSDVRTRVVWRDRYWLTDEALSTYIRSAGLFGHEMHSPIMCVGNGVPALVVRWKEQTSKGLMWRDIGLGDWLFDFDCEDERGRFPEFAVAWAQTLSRARSRTKVARECVEQHQAEAMMLLRQELGLSPATTRIKQRNQ